MISEGNSIKKNMKLHLEGNNNSKSKKDNSKNSKCKEQNNKLGKEKDNNKRKRKEWRWISESKWCKSLQSKIGLNKWLNRKEGWDSWSIREKLRKCGKRN